MLHLILPEKGHSDFHNVMSRKARDLQGDIMVEFDIYQSEFISDTNRQWSISVHIHHLLSLPSAMQPNDVLDEIVISLAILPTKRAGLV
jgi:hypothetical protein